MPERQQMQQSKKPDTIFQKQTAPVIQTPLSNPYSIIQRAKINPKSLTHADVMQLQRTIGNRAVGRLLSSIGNTSTSNEAPIQRSEIPEEEEKPMQGKFETVQRSEIPEEEEPLQGKIVGTVQRQEIPEEEEPLQGKIIGTVQRQEIPEEEEPLQGKMVEPIQRQEIPEEEPLQGKMADTVQRQEIPEEEEPLQGKTIGTVQRQEVPEEEKPLQTKKENNTGMPDNLKAGVENLFGIDMSDVRVHYNSSKPADVGALAYTQGTDIHVASGQEKHLPHEAWHVVQQKQGRVQPTMQLKGGVSVNDDEGLEHEADVMGGRVLQAHKSKNSLEDKFNQLNANRSCTLFEPDIHHENKSSGLLQRMAVMAVDNMDIQKDTLVWDNLQYAESQAGGKVGDLQNNKVWNNLRNEENIRIVEHGEPKKVGGKTAIDIANSMKTGDHTLPQNVKIGEVTFQSCYAGLDVKGSLVSEMKYELEKMGQRNVVVKGRTGVAFGFKGMGEETAKNGTEPYKWVNKNAETLYNSLTNSDEYGFKAYCDAMYQCRFEKTKNKNTPIFKFPFEFKYNKPWELLLITEQSWRNMTASNKASQMSEEMEIYWKKISEFMKMKKAFESIPLGITSMKTL